MSISNILGWRFRRIHYHELERMFGWLFHSPFSLGRFRNNSWYYNSDIHRWISRLYLIYNFVEGFFRVKSILWGESLLFDSRIEHIMNTVISFSMSIQLFKSFCCEGTLVANELFFIHLVQLSKDKWIKRGKYILYIWKYSNLRMRRLTHESLRSHSRATIPLRATSNSRNTSHSRATTHEPRVTEESLLPSQQLLTSHYSRVTHESLVPHEPLLTSRESLTSHYLRTTSHSRATTHESLTSHSRVTRYSGATSQSRVTRYSLATSHSRATTHESFTSH